MTTKWPLNTRVEIEFVDACTNGNWNSVDVHRRDSHPSLCRTIGYLVEHTAKYVTVAQSISSNSQNCADTMSVPRAAVKRMRRVKGF